MKKMKRYVVFVSILDRNSNKSVEVATLGETDLLTEAQALVASLYKHVYKKC